jgi:hypothetical protein
MTKHLIFKGVRRNHIWPGACTTDYLETLYAAIRISSGQLCGQVCIERTVDVEHFRGFALETILCNCDFGDGSLHRRLGGQQLGTAGRWRALATGRRRKLYPDCEQHSCRAIQLECGRHQAIDGSRQHSRTGNALLVGHRLAWARRTDAAQTESQAIASSGRGSTCGRLTLPSQPLRLFVAFSSESSCHFSNSRFHLRIVHARVHRSLIARVTAVMSQSGITVDRYRECP